jgi:hypothetical protein
MVELGRSCRDAVQELPAERAAGTYRHAGSVRRGPLCADRRARDIWRFVAPRRKVPIYLAALDTETAILATVADLAVYRQDIVVFRRIAELSVDLPVLDLGAAGAVDGHDLAPILDPRWLWDLGGAVAARRDVAGFVIPFPDCFDTGDDLSILGILPRALKGQGVDLRGHFVAEARVSFASEVEVV